MKKILIGCSLLCFIAVQASAQIPSFNQGDNVAGIGIGLGGYYFGTGYSSTPYLTGYFENCVIDNLFDEQSSLGIGGTIGYKSNKYEKHLHDGSSPHGWKYTYLLIGVRGSLHYAFVDKLDTYAGLMIGYRVSSSKKIGTPNDNAESYGGPTSDLYIGARYYFTDTFAAFLELGYSWFSLGTVGVSFKF